MRRREFLGMAVSARLVLAQNQNADVVTASPTQDTIPRVGIVLSSFRESVEHNSTKLKGLDDPRPPGVDLTAAQIDAMVRKAIELSSTRRGNLGSIVGPEDWVVIKTHIPSCYGSTPEAGAARRSYIPGSVTDLRVVQSVLSYLAERKCGLRFTIAEGSGEWRPIEQSKSPVDGWNTQWDGEFEGLSYRKMIANLAGRFPHARFEIADLNFAPSIEVPVQGKALAHNNPSGTYTIAKVVRQCDWVISIAPLKTDPLTGVSLTAGNYFGIAPGSKYGFPKNGLLNLGNPDEIAADLLSYHPPEFAILGGCRGIEGAGSIAATVHHNLIIAGGRPNCVDAVAAAVMGFDPFELPFLAFGESRGFGTREVDAIWTRGNTIEEASKPFRKPPDWRPPVTRKGIGK